MTRHRVVASALVAACLLVPAGAFPQKSSIEGLCRTHGIGEEGQVVRITKAYDDAVSAGIREEELLPFVEDVLRHKLDCPQMVRVLAAAAQLARSDLPYFVVFSKVREGVTKQAPPVLVVEAAEAKRKTLFDSRDVLNSLESSGYRVLDFRNAALVVVSYLEKGYTSEEVVSRIRTKGLKDAGFAALTGVMDKPLRRDAQ